jgi:Cytochrome c7 and related cytochrome c
MSHRPRAKTAIKAVLLAAALVVFGASCLKQGEKVNVPLTSADTPDPIPQRVSNSTFQAFSHGIPEHKQFACDTCHSRDGKALTSKFGGHESCIGCHLNQFTSTETQAMCTICHTDTKSSDPPVKAFPAKFIEGFNMRFDHAAHDSGAGRPAAGCVACHNPSGPGQTIPVGINAHADCYGCHTPDKKIGSCSTCHQLGAYNRTTQSEYGFKAIFTHGDHRGVGCGECHSVRAGAPNSQQVTNIAIREHLTSPGNNCAECHNGRRAFTGNNVFDVGSCSRCHGSSGPSKIPGAELPAGTTPDM